jgi:hypothetical protein
MVVRRPQMVFALLVATGVFILVPRGLSTGEITIQSDHMSWNTSKGTYQLDLLAKIPIFNPNYLAVKTPCPDPLQLGQQG